MNSKLKIVSKTRKDFEKVEYLTFVFYPLRSLVLKCIQSTLPSASRQLEV